VADLVSPEGPEWRAAAREELLQLIDDLLYTEKTHLAAAERFSRVHLRLGLTATILATTATATSIARWSVVATALIALSAALVSAVLTFIKPERTAEQHLSAGRQLAALRVRSRQVLTLDLGRVSEAEVRRSIRELAREKAAVDAAAPGTSEKDFSVARKIARGDFQRDD
jgi:hypothetical protein